jgi:hypothetical protein
MDDFAFEPWVKYPPLTKKRLSVIGVLIRDTRDKTVLLHEPEEGDNAWSLGCRVYARTCAQFRKASTQFDWLSILQESKALRFTFAAGGVPLKFYRGDVGDAPGRCKVISDAEAAAQQLLFDLGELQDDDRLLRLVVEADSDGKTTTVTLAELDKSGRLTGKYVIPFDVEADALPALPPAVDPGPPPIMPLPQKDANQEEKRREGNVG